VDTFGQERVRTSVPEAVRSGIGWEPRLVLHLDQFVPDAFQEIQELGLGIGVSVFCGVI
jgi:hypothetical protein